MTAKRSQAPASEALLSGEVAGQWAQVHLHPINETTDLVALAALVEAVKATEVRAP